MRKYIVNMIMVFCLVIAMGDAQVSAQHFDYNEAWQIISGDWYDTETGEERTLVWKSKDGSECNIVSSSGYTDPKGDSRIYFDYKGIPARMDITYYSDQNTYYGKLYLRDKITQKLVVFNTCMTKK